jgi:hypothetical protein
MTRHTLPQRISVTVAAAPTKQSGEAQADESGGAGSVESRLRLTVRRLSPNE